MLKGMALLLLLFHHLLKASESSAYDSYYLFDGRYDIITGLASFAKVCVAIFVFLSGYGLTRSVKKSHTINILLFYYRHILKVLINYWFVWIIFVPIGVYVFSYTFYDAYGTNSIIPPIINILGLQVMTGTGSYNPTWWFITAIICLYLLYPILYKLIKIFREVLIICVFLFLILIQPCWWEPVGLNLWLPLDYSILSFILGIYFAEFNYIQFLKDKKTKVLVLISSIILLLFVVGIGRLYFGLFLHYLDAFLALFVIIIGFIVINVNSFLGKCLEQIGKYSMDIFLFHTFLYGHWFRDIIYYTRDPIISFITLLLLSVLVAYIIDKIKRVIHFDRLFKILLAKR